jgi:hypothetical protein
MADKIGDQFEKVCTTLTSGIAPSDSKSLTPAEVCKAAGNFMNDTDAMGKGSEKWLRGHVPGYGAYLDGLNSVVDKIGKTFTDAVRNYNSNHAPTPTGGSTPAISPQQDDGIKKLKDDKKVPKPFA